MTNLKNTTARFAVAALLALSPVAAFADTETGSPQQSVDSDPNEQVENAATGTSMEQTAKADQCADATDGDCMEAEVAEDVDGSLVEDDAKSDG